MGRRALFVVAMVALLVSCSDDPANPGTPDGSSLAQDVGPTDLPDVGLAQDAGSSGVADGGGLEADAGPTVIELAGCGEGYQRPESLENDCRSPWVEDVGGTPIAGCNGTTLKLVFATTQGTEEMFVCGCTTYCPKLCPPRGEAIFEVSVFGSSEIPAACDDGSAAPDAGSPCVSTGNACIDTSECCQGRCSFWGGSSEPLLGRCAD